MNVVIVTYRPSVKFAHKKQVFTCQKAAHFKGDFHGKSD